MTLEHLNEICRGTLMETLGIVYGMDEKGGLTATMPVSDGHKQPFGHLHGGATIALAESLGSAASLFMLDGKSIVMGTQVNSQHLNSVRSGIVTASSELIFQNDKIHIWDIFVRYEQNRIISITRITNRIIVR